MALEYLVSAAIPVTLRPPGLSSIDGWRPARADCESASIVLIRWHMPTYDGYIVSKHYRRGYNDLPWASVIQITQSSNGADYQEYTVEPRACTTCLHSLTRVKHVPCRNVAISCTLQWLTPDVSSSTYPRAQQPQNTPHCQPYCLIRTNELLILHQNKYYTDEIDLFCEYCKINKNKKPSCR